MRFGRAFRATSIPLTPDELQLFAHRAAHSARHVTHSVRDAALAYLAHPTERVTVSLPRATIRERTRMAGSRTRVPQLLRDAVLRSLGQAKDHPSAFPARIPAAAPDTIVEEEAMASALTITGPPSARPRTHRYVEFKAVAILAWKRCQRDECSGLAAQAAYHILFALFPLAIFAAALSALVNAVFGLNLFDAIMASLASVLPGEARVAIVAPMAAVVNHRSGWLLLLGIVTALSSGATAVGTFITALNRAYAVEETRPFWRRKGLEILLTLCMGTAVTAAFILIVFGGRLGTVIAVHVGLGTPFRAVWEIGRWPLIAVIITAALAVFYWIAPNIGQRFQWLSAGAILGTVVWILAMGGFGLYVGKFGQYDKTYGTLGGVMILLLVFYISSLIVILGGELNGALSRRHHAETIAAIAAQSEHEKDETIGADGTSENRSRGRKNRSVSRSFGIHFKFWSRGMDADTRAGMKNRRVSSVALGGSEKRMQSVNETPPTRQPEPVGGEILAAEAAEARTLAQRAAAPEAGRQDWLAAEEVAVGPVPEQEMPAAGDMHDRTERPARSPRTPSTRMARFLRCFARKRRER